MFSPVEFPLAGYFAVSNSRENASRISAELLCARPQSEDMVLTESWEIFVEQYPQMMKAYRRLAKADWFQKSHWVAFVGHYTNGIFMQVYKPHWYNHEFEGIHFELALDARCLKNKAASIQLHTTHKNVLPDRDQFNQYTIPRMAETVRPWGPRYELSETKLSERLNLNVPFTQTSFAQKAAEEMAQVCQLGAIIDEALAKLWGRELGSG